MRTDCGYKSFHVSAFIQISSFNSGKFSGFAVSQKTGAIFHEISHNPGAAMSNSVN